LNTLAKHIHIDRVLESNLARSHESSVPGNALEALIGAIFLDKGFERTRKVVVRLILRHFDLKEIEKEDKDGKSRLLEWGQKRRRKVEFVVREEHGGPRGRIYVAEVLIAGDVKGTGRGVSKKSAEQEAAQSAFQRMRSRQGAASGTAPGNQEAPSRTPRRRPRQQPGA
jgi:ribonuclease-3